MSKSRTTTSTAWTTMTPEEALEAFEFDYNAISETPEAQSSYFNVDGVYRRSSWDFVPNMHYVNANIDPRAFGGFRDIQYSPACTAYWRGLLQFCSDDARLFKRWRPDYGREAFGMGTVVVRSYHSVAESFRWFDFQKSDQLIRRCMTLAREALAGLNIKVPEVIFSGMLAPIPDKDPVYAKISLVPPKEPPPTSAVLVTERIPGIALDRIIDSLPKTLVQDLHTQIKEVVKRLKKSPREVDYKSRHGMRFVHSKHWPGTKKHLEVCNWFDKEWASRDPVHVPIPSFLQESQEDASWSWQDIGPTPANATVPSASTPAFMKKSVESIEVFHDAPVHSRPSRQRAKSSSATVKHVQCNPWNDLAPVYSGVDSDLDSTEGGLLPRNIIVSGGRIVGVQGMALLKLLL